MTAVDEVETETRKVQGRRHISELQSFRGIAALVVLVHHSSFYYRHSPSGKSLIETLLNAHAAVVAFYVLSGLVLAISLSTQRPDSASWGRFMIRRAFRVYPALWIACAAGAAYLLVFRATPAPANVSDWWPAAYRDDVISKAGVVAAFMGFGNELPVPIWSISVELIGSLMMPWLAWWAAKRRAWFALSTAVLLALSLTTRHTLLVYLVAFAFGASILWWAPHAKRLLSNDRRTLCAAMVALVFLMFGRQLGGWRYATHYHSAAAALVESLAATALIGSIYVNSAPFALLRSKWATFVGNISYSLYLLHMPVMAFIAGIGGEMLHLSVLNGDGAIASTTLAIATAAIAVPLSTLSYRYVELPGIRLGATWLARRAPRAPQGSEQPRP